jgi:hypothetical protein
MKSEIQTQGNVNSKREIGERQLVLNEQNIEKIRDIEIQVHCRYLILTSVPDS